MNRFRIAVVQKRSVAYDRDGNLQDAVRLMEQAKEKQADLVLFPECYLTGYVFPELDEERPLTEIRKDPAYEKWSSFAVEDDSKWIREICQAVKRLNIGVVFTSFTKGNVDPQNSAYVIDRTGQILMKYSKVHTCDFASERYVEGGDEFKVCDFDGVKIGVMICYDREYPESARVLMMKGAEIIVVPNDCGSMRPRLQALSTRAYENMTGVVMANAPGKNAGCSCAFSPIVWDEDGIPIDNVLFIAEEQKEGVYLADFDLDILRAYRSDEMMGNTFRKVKAYQELLNEQIAPPFQRNIY